MSGFSMAANCHYCLGGHLVVSCRNVYCELEVGGARAFLNEPQIPTHSQGCQIFLGTKYQNVKNIPNVHKIYQMAVKLTKCP
jgi:hypothetical protein